MITKVDVVDEAVFGNFDVRPVSKLTLTAGFRFLHDTLKWNHKRVTGPNGDHIGGGVGMNPAGQIAPGANVGTPAFNFIRNFSDSALIGKLAAKYEFTPDVLVYASWARGYKGQAVDADIFLTQQGYDVSPVAPEKSRAWETHHVAPLFYGSIGAGREASIGRPIDSHASLKGLESRAIALIQPSGGGACPFLCMTYQFRSSLSA